MRKVQAAGTSLLLHPAPTDNDLLVLTAVMILLGPDPRSVEIITESSLEATLRALKGDLPANSTIREQLCRLFELLFFMPDRAAGGRLFLSWTECELEPMFLDRNIGCEEQEDSAFIVRMNPQGCRLLRAALGLGDDEPDKKPLLDLLVRKIATARNFINVAVMNACEDHELGGSEDPNGALQYGAVDWDRLRREIDKALFDILSR